MHGGARRGAGRKPKSEKAKADGGPDPYLLLAKAKAKKEMFKAHMAEIEYREASAELYPRDEVLRVITTTIAIFSEQMRSLPDKLEREAGLTPKQAEIAEHEVDSQLEALKQKLLKAMRDG